MSEPDAWRDAMRRASGGIVPPVAPPDPSSRPMPSRWRRNRWRISVNTAGGRVEGTVRGTAEDAADAVAAILDAFRQGARP